MSRHLIENFELAEEDLEIDALKAEERRERRANDPRIRNRPDLFPNMDDEDAAGAAFEAYEESCIRFRAEMDHLMELEPEWLIFRGHYHHMQAVLRLRFKVMELFMRRLREPNSDPEPPELGEEERRLLECLEKVFLNI